MITCIKCGEFMAENNKDISSICLDCAGELADNMSLTEQVAMAKVGLDALIDTATGFEKVRPKDDLRNRHRVYKGEE